MSKTHVSKMNLSAIRAEIKRGKLWLGWAQRQYPDGRYTRDIQRIKDLEDEVIKREQAMKKK